MKKWFLFFLVLSLVGLQIFENPQKLNASEKRSIKTNSEIVLTGKTFGKVMSDMHLLSSKITQNGSRYYKTPFVAPNEDELIILSYSSHKKLPLKLNPDPDTVHAVHKAISPE